MDEKNSSSWHKLQQKSLSRRNLIRGAAGTAAGAGLLLGSGLRSAAHADDEDEGKHNKCKVLARPIPHISRRHQGNSNSVTSASVVQEQSREAVSKSAHF